MSKVRFNEGRIIFGSKPCSREFFEQTIEEVHKAKDKFTGYLGFCVAQDEYFLFFLTGRVYAAGGILDAKPYSLTIKELLGKISAGTGAGMTISLHETDPVLLKCMLVFFQAEPSVKAAASLINMDEIIAGIAGSVSDAVIALKKGELVSFFFFKDGKAIMSRMADPDFAGSEGSEPGEQLLLYAYPADLTPVEAFVFGNIATSEAVDAKDITEVDLVKMIYRVNDRPTIETPIPEKDGNGEKVFITILEGMQKGRTFMAPVPCTLGRKDADITLPDPKISRQHARIVKANGKLSIEDLKSTNGTFVNGESVSEIPLEPGDKIMLGDTILRIE